MGDLRLHIGCGLVAPEAWINIDRSPNVLLDRARPAKHLLRRLGLLERDHMRSWPRNIQRMDVTKGLPFGDGSASAIYSSHMLEHLYLDQAAFVLGECHRVIAPGGIVRLALPDSDLLAQELLAGVDDGFADAGTRFTHGLNDYPAAPPTRRQALRGLFSANVHRWQPTRALIHRLLSDAGFTQISEREYRDGDLPDLDLLEHRAESIFTEARP